MIVGMRASALTPLASLTLRTTFSLPGGEGGRGVGEGGRGVGEGGRGGEDGRGFGKTTFELGPAE